MPLGSDKSTHLADTIIQKILETNIMSAQEWEGIIYPDFRLHLIKEFGLTVDSYIQKIIRVVRSQRIGNIKKKGLSQLLMEVVETEITTELQVPNDETLEGFNSLIQWLRYLFKANKIDITTFFAWNECIKTMRYMKVNSIVLERYTNAGKSLIIRYLISVCLPEEIPRERDNSGFHMDQLPAASCALFEEPLITPQKRRHLEITLGRQRGKNRHKHKDKEGIYRIPIWITTATHTTKHVDDNESIQIEQRTQVFEFSKCIKHRRVARNLTAQLRRRAINKSPTYITPVHFALFWLFYYKEIMSRIAKIKEEHTINRSRLRVTNTVKRRCEEWQHRLRNE
jgi:hypothetical protein